jgi:hypothetical protein
MPERFLLQIMRNLVEHGLLESIRRAESGYLLAKSPAEITLCDIVTAFDNPLEPRLPPTSGTPCHSPNRFRKLSSNRVMPHGCNCESFRWGTYSPRARRTSGQIAIRAYPCETSLQKRMSDPANKQLPKDYGGATSSSTRLIGSSIAQPTSCHSERP